MFSTNTKKRSNSILNNNILNSPLPSNTPIYNNNNNNNNYNDNYEIKENNISKLPSMTFFSFFKAKNIALFFLIIFIFAFLGYNIFTYLGQGTDYLTKLLKPLGINIANKTGDVTKNTTNTSLTGTKKLLEVGVDTTSTTLDTAKKGTDTSIDFIKEKIKKSDNKTTTEPEPVSTSSYKQGYCFIGKINDTRYCAKVSSGTQCMSGEVYQREESCINPN